MLNEVPLTLFRLTATLKSKKPEIKLNYNYEIIQIMFDVCLCLE